MVKTNFEVKKDNFNKVIILNFINYFQLQLSVLTAVKSNTNL